MLHIWYWEVVTRECFSFCRKIASWSIPPLLTALFNGYFVVDRLAIIVTGRTSIIHQIRHINRNKLDTLAKMTLRETIQTDPDRWCHFSYSRILPLPALHAKLHLPELNPCSSVCVLTVETNAARKYTTPVCMLDMFQLLQWNCFRILDLLRGVKRFSGSQEIIFNLMGGSN